MNQLARQFEKANRSGFRLWLLNIGLLRVVPFNRPHGIKISEISSDSITVKAKNKKPNQNHIKGIHACLLATLCEYVSGLNLLLQLDPKEYRIILKNIQMTYHYQAKTDVSATFGIPKAFFEDLYKQKKQYLKNLPLMFTTKSETTFVQVLSIGRSNRGKM
jgi:hypothetical protein